MCLHRIIQVQENNHMEIHINDILSFSNSLFTKKNLKITIILDLGQKKSRKRRYDVSRRQGPVC